MNLSPHMRFLIERSKMYKFSKLGFVGLVAMGLVGCATNGGAANKYVSNNQVEGVIYGAALWGDADMTVDAICNSIKNKDDRCLSKQNYKTVAVAAKFGYADGFTGIIALADKDMDIGNACRTGSSNCTYLKAKVEKGKLGTVLEVASRPGDGKCHWGGMPRVGGTVCPAYNYDYSKDFNGIAHQ
jgi:hypothetical protein